MPSPPIRRALISVSNKLGILDFARAIGDCGVEIYSTGGTRRHLESEGLPVRDVSEHTGFPEMMDGRLKTLHPLIFGGILCRRDNEHDMAAAGEHGIVPFELVVVNLYPFEATIAREGVTEPEAIEQIDIGGPSLVRAAAKNHAFVTIATDPAQYASILEEMAASGGTSPSLRRRLMAAAFAHTANYDRIIAEYFSGGGTAESAPQQLSLSWRKKADLRYGENPHQWGAVYADLKSDGPGVVSARQLHGKELSYNNLLDLDSAVEIVREMSRPAAVVIKHNNPCGAAVADSLAEAAVKALAGDATSAFGSILGFNRTVDAAAAEALSEPGLFIEAIAAPDFDEAAIEILTTRPKWKGNVRLMQIGRLDGSPGGPQIRQISGGLLMQGESREAAAEEWRTVTAAPLPDRLRDELAFAWSIVRHVKSNAIVLAKELALCGVGAGQMSRVDAVDIAIAKAGRRAGGAVLASDAFFPFPDSIEKAAAAGIAAVIQPGGSRGDDAVIEAADAHNLPMVLTGRRFFKH